MSRTDPQTRIAEALERLSPPPPPEADPLTHAAYVWRSGALATARFTPLPLDLLSGIERQKAAVLDTVRRLAREAAAHDVLLWGARGSGKSALVKSAVAAVREEGLDVALVEVGADALASLPSLFDRLELLPRAFVLFVDDLGFDDPGGEAPRLLRSLLEGGADARPANLRLFVTANRRHILPRDAAEQESALALRDVIDDRLALADRFGLSLGFHVVDQPGYLAMVAGYARRFDLAFDDAEAIRWATERGSRSGRVAWQFVVELAGRAGRPLEPGGARNVAAGTDGDRT